MIFSLEVQSTIKYGTRLTLGLRPANERQCYFVTTSLIGWAYMIGMHVIYCDTQVYINALVQDSSNSIANALELPLSCIKP